MTLNTQFLTLPDEEPETYAQTDLTADLQFYLNIMKGLNHYPKFLPSKYFYNAAGDRLFQQIMDCPEYYLTACELEIFTHCADELSSMISEGGEPFDLIELGAGDCKKTMRLLQHLAENKKDFTYMPIDISENVINGLNTFLPTEIPSLQFKGLCGEYMPMLEKAVSCSSVRKVILCLGGNVGNMTVSEALEFSMQLRGLLQPGDMVITGFDLKKNPRIIKAAYDDKGGITRRFNLNLLLRINEELGADFDAGSFEHYCSYDPETGSCKSYLIAQKDMTVSIRNTTVTFKQDEYIWMEISQKYAMDELNQLAASAGFQSRHYFFDHQRWFTDAVWIAE